MTVERYFEVHDAEREAYLAGLDPEALLQLGVDLYNAGHYWNAHEAWEEVWLEAPNEQRAFYQGLIQVTAAFVHVTRGEYPGSVRLLQAGIAKLERYAPTYLGIEVEGLVTGTKAALARLLALGERRVSEFERGLIPRIEWRPGETGRTRRRMEA
jgi:hypothetical protein